MTDLFPAQNKTEPSSDPCRTGQPLSNDRVATLTLCFVAMLACGASLGFISNQFVRAVACVLTDTAAVTLYTFSANKGGMRPFMLSCPIVQRLLPRLIRRHLGFLALLVALQFAAFQVRPYLPIWWTTADDKNWTPFIVVLAAGFGCFALAEVVTNRSLLNAAHERTEDESTE